MPSVLIASDKCFVEQPGGIAHENDADRLISEVIVCAVFNLPPDLYVVPDIGFRQRNGGRQL